MPFYKVPATSMTDIQRGCQTTRNDTTALAHGTSTRVVDSEKDGSEKSSTFAELTEADRDAEVMRRTLEQEVEQSQQLSNFASHDHMQTSEAKISPSEARANKIKSAIEAELNLQRQREAELAASRQGGGGISPSGSLASSSADSSSSVGRRGNGPDEPSRASTGKPSACESCAEGMRGVQGVQGVEGVEGVERRYAHPGESRIVREFHEQHAREAELRGRWKEMGMNVPDDVTNHSETPFTLPQPIPMTSHGNHKSGISPSSAAAVDKHDGPGQGRINGHSIAAESFASSTETTSQPSGGKKVVPFDYPELNGEEKLPYLPAATETPIEREIRRAREREHALRLERGMTRLLHGPEGLAQNATSITAEDEEIAIELVDGGSGGRVDGTPGGHPTTKVTLKKLANSRLVMEMNKEKQREMELKSQGSIHTTSEERTGDLLTGYVDIISHHVDAADAIEVTPRSKYIAAVSPSHTGLPTAPHENSYSQRNLMKKSATWSLESTRIPLDEGKSSDVLPIIGGGTLRKGSKEPSRAELKIQEEMNELLRREEELRHRQRTGDGSARESTDCNHNDSTAS